MAGVYTDRSLPSYVVKEHVLKISYTIHHDTKYLIFVNNICRLNSPIFSPVGTYVFLFFSIGLGITPFDTHPSFLFQRGLLLLPNLCTRPFQLSFSFFQDCFSCASIFYYCQRCSFDSVVYTFLRRILFSLSILWLLRFRPCNKILTTIASKIRHLTSFSLLQNTPFMISRVLSACVILFFITCDEKFVVVLRYKMFS